jgi:hypothetical protein
MRREPTKLELLQNLDWIKDSPDPQGAVRDALAQVRAGANATSRKAKTVTDALALKASLLREKQECQMRQERVRMRQRTIVVLQVAAAIGSLVAYFLSGQLVTPIVLVSVGMAVVSSILLASLRFAKKKNEAEISKREFEYAVFGSLSEMKLETIQLEPRIDNLLAGKDAIERLDQRVESLLGGPILDKFDGTVSVVMLDASGAGIPFERGVLLVAPGQPCKIRVQIASKSACASTQSEGEGVPNFPFVPAGTPEEGAGAHVFHDSVHIRRGNSASSVTFTVVLDSNEVRFEVDRLSATFNSRFASPPVVFGFAAPSEKGGSEIYVQVLQQNSLIQVVPLSLLVR